MIRDFERPVETDARWTNHLDLEGALERVEMSDDTQGHAQHHAFRAALNRK